MANHTPEERRQFFIESLERIAAVDFFFTEPNSIQKIYLLFGIDQDEMGATYYLQSYSGIGFSLILEKIDQNHINLKIHEPITDHFYVCPNVIIKANALDRYELAHEPPVYLGVGMVRQDGIIDHSTAIHIPLKSVSFA